MGMLIDQKIVIVTRDTQLGALKRKFSTRGQAKFHMVSSAKRELSKKAKAAEAAVELEQLEQRAEEMFQSVELADVLYEQSVKQLHGDLDFDDFDLPVQKVDRSFLPNFLFGPRDVVVTVGQDGLVANTAKYAVGLPIVAVNPDPGRIDGVLLPFRTDQARAAVRSVLNGKARYREVTLAEARLADGQRLLAFNELFIGSRTHVSARYRLTVNGRTEAQSSSGVLVSTGAGSTGWLSSVFNMAAGVASAFGRATTAAPLKLRWEDPRLVYVVREPFVSKSSNASLVAGVIDAGQDVALESDMPADGVIFSDGVEADYLEFNAGAVARIAPAKQRSRLVVPA
jgi:NAD kinase